MKDHSLLGRFLRYMATPSISPLFMVLWCGSLDVQNAYGWVAWGICAVVVVVVCVAFELAFGGKGGE